MRVRPDTPPCRSIKELTSGGIWRGLAFLIKHSRQRVLILSVDRRKESYENKIHTGKKAGADRTIICYAFNDHFYGVCVCSIDNIICFQST